VPKLDIGPFGASLSPGDDVDRVTDRFFDAVVAWGTPERIAKKAQEYLYAGADQVVLNLRGVPSDVRRELAELLIPSG